VRRLATTLLLALAAAAPGAAAPASASAACPGADAELGPSLSTDVAGAERAMLCLLNEYRLASGLSPLVLDERLGRAARAHGLDMVARGYFSHDTPEGLDPTARAGLQGFPSGVGENIAYSTHATPRSLFEQWRASAGHDSNMRHPSYTVVGMGLALGVPPRGPASRGATAVQDFGRVAAVSGATGLEDGAPEAEAGDEAVPRACAAAAARTRALAAAVQRRRRQVAAAAARVRADRARVSRARGRRAHRRAVRRLRASRRSLARARAFLRASRTALARAADAACD